MAKKGTYWEIEAQANKQSYKTRLAFLEYLHVYRLEVI